MSQHHKNLLLVLFILITLMETTYVISHIQSKCIPILFTYCMYILLISLVLIFQPSMYSHVNKCDPTVKYGQNTFSSLWDSMGYIQSVCSFFFPHPSPSWYPHIILQIRHIHRKKELRNNSAYTFLKTLYLLPNPPIFELTLNNSSPPNKSSNKVYINRRLRRSAIQFELPSRSDSEQRVVRCPSPTPYATGSCGFLRGIHLGGSTCACKNLGPCTREVQETPTSSKINSRQSGSTQISIFLTI